MIRHAVLLALTLWAGAALAGDHRLVPPVELEPGAYYVLRDRIPLRAYCEGEPPAVPPHWWVRGSILKVRELKERAPSWICYRVKWIKPETIGSADDLWGLVNRLDLPEAGLHQPY